ncbi:MAG: hypothetical protein ABW184_12715 [Sphingobium sp.]
MPQPLSARLPHRAPSKADFPRAGADHPAHHFDEVHGDVALLHARIASEFTESSFDFPPQSAFAGRFDRAVQHVSRAAGLVGFAAALTGIALLII